MRAGTALGWAIALALVSILAILASLPDAVIAVLLGAFGLFGFLALSAERDPFDIEDGGEASE